MPADIVLAYYMYMKNKKLATYKSKLLVPQ